MINVFGEVYKKAHNVSFDLKLVYIYLQGVQHSSSIPGGVTGQLINHQNINIYVLTALVKHRPEQEFVQSRIRVGSGNRICRPGLDQALIRIYYHKVLVYIFYTVLRDELCL